MIQNKILLFFLFKKTNLEKDIKPLNKEIIYSLKEIEYENRNNTLYYYRILIKKILFIISLILSIIYVDNNNVNFFFSNNYISQKTEKLTLNLLIKIFRKYQYINIKNMDDEKTKKKLVKNLCLNISKIEKIKLDTNHIETITYDEIDNNFKYFKKTILNIIMPLGIYLDTEKKEKIYKKIHKIYKSLLLDSCFLKQKNRKLDFFMEDFLLSIFDIKKKEQINLKKNLQQKEYEKTFNFLVKQKCNIIEDFKKSITYDEWCSFLIKKNYFSKIYLSFIGQFILNDK